MPTSPSESRARVYLDHAASTPPRPRARAALSSWVEAANASAPHAAGQAARVVVEEAREQVAGALHCSPHDVVFTSGGTEADNLALKGVVWAARDAMRSTPHVVTTAVEHPAVLAAARWLADRGDCHLDVVAPRNDGRVDVERVLAAVRDDTVLVSVMTANNELGSVNDIPALVAALAERPGRLGAGRGSGRVRAGGGSGGVGDGPVPVHTDAVQAVATREVDVSGDGVAALALSAHKFGGPQGVGVAVLRRGLPVEPLTHGGGQDRGVRSGTFATGLVAAFAAGLSAAVDDRPALVARLTALSDRLADGLLAIDGIHRNGPDDPAWRLPSHVHVGLDDVDPAALALALDRAEVAATSGSACGSGAATASPVLAACGIGGTPLRLSLGWTSTDADVDRALDVLTDVVPRLRAGASLRTVR